MSHKKCCVPNCGSTREDNVILHSFPDPNKEPDRFRSWIYAIGGDILALNNNKIYRYRKVCHKHFVEKFHTYTRRLSADAVPTLNLSDTADRSKASHTQNITKTDKQPESVDKEAEVETRYINRKEYVLKEAVEDDLLQPASPTDIPVPEQVAFSWQKCSAVVPCDADTAASESFARGLPGAGDDACIYDDVTAACPQDGAGSGKPPLVHGSADASRDCGAGYRCNSCAELVSGSVSRAANQQQRSAVAIAPVWPQGLTEAEIQSVLDSIRRILMSDSILAQVVTEDDVKSEVKEEEEDLPDPLLVERPALAAGSEPGSEAEADAREEGSEVDSADDGVDDVTWSPHSCTKSKTTTTRRAHRAGGARAAPGAASKRAGTSPKKLQQRCDKLNYSTRAIMPLEGLPRTTCKLSNLIKIDMRPKSYNPARRKGSETPEPPAGEAAARTASRDTCGDRVLDVRLAPKRKIIIVPAGSALAGSLENETRHAKLQKTCFKESLCRISVGTQEIDSGGTSLLRCQRSST